jgi:DNA mismatch repair protein MutS
MEAAIRAGGAAIAYLRDNQRGAVAHINRLQRKRREHFALIDATAQRNLELLASQQDGERTSTLLEVLDRTRTPMGARLLRQWVIQPLKDPALIEARLAAVDELLTGREDRRALRQFLERVGDLERLMARICCQRANARDMVALARSLALAPDIGCQLQVAQSPLLQELRDKGLPDVDALVAEILSALVDEPPATLTEGGLIRDGYHGEVDEWRRIASGGKDYIARLQTTERERTGIASLKIGYNQVFGYYIEISKANLDKAPTEYHRKQTLTNAERYITPELKEYEEKVIGAEDRLKELENELFLKLRERTAAWTPKVQQIARTLARIDLLSGLAEVAESEAYVRPQIDDGTLIDIRDGRHPVVERKLRDGRFVPNDVRIDSAGAQILLITGPNMAGKSTIIRQVGLIVLMAQMGSFVPARQAKIGVVDRIFTRVGASDNLARGESTFMVEMNEAANILNNATTRSLILMDELGRGTSTFDGLSIAWSIVEYLHQRRDAHPRTLFATHYHEMTELEAHLERVVNFNVQVREEGDRVVFLHRLAPGPADQSYGINVAQMAGMPAQVISRAAEILARLEKEQIDTEGIHDGRVGEAWKKERPEQARTDPHPRHGHSAVPAPESEIPPDPEAQLNLFPTTPDAPWAAELLDMDLSQVTPLQALIKLNEWKEKMREGRQNR